MCPCHMGLSPNLPVLCAPLIRAVVWELVHMPSMSMQRVKGKHAMQSVVRGKDVALGRRIIRVSPAAHVLGVHVGVRLHSSNIQLNVA